ncbi:capsid protein [Enterobacter roggenkampii]|nr:capsid protein [Enterobacter roggenkampii]
MRKDTRFKFNAYLSRVAELNGVSTDDVAKKFTVEPSVTQTLMTTLQMSSAFLTKINIVPVDELKGEKSRGGRQRHDCEHCRHRR